MRGGVDAADDFRSTLRWRTMTRDYAKYEQNEERRSRWRRLYYTRLSEYFPDSANDDGGGFPCRTTHKICVCAGIFRRVSHTQTQRLIGRRSQTLTTGPEVCTLRRRWPPLDLVILEESTRLSLCRRSRRLSYRLAPKLSLSYYRRRQLLYTLQGPGEARLLRIAVPR